MKSTKLTLEFRNIEAKMLEDLVEEGLFATKSEAVRSALVKLAIDLGYFNREKLWTEISSGKRRKVTPKRLMRDLEKVRDETK
jgi:Arc/MetJ-type ribon-helix-helix transcriptional regulator